MRKKVYWVLFEIGTAGNYIYTENSNADTFEHIYSTEKEMRQHLQATVENYGLIHFSPDIAANPLEIDAICVEKAKTDILFSDQSKLSSTHRFKSGHEQVIKFRLKTLVNSGGRTKNDWLVAADVYQVVMLRREIIKDIYQENSHVMFVFKDGRPDYLSDWDSTEEATKKLTEFQAQFKKI